MYFTPARMRASLSTLGEHRFVTFAVLTDTIGAGLTLPLSIVYFTLTTDVPLALIGALSTIAALVALPIGLIGGALTDRFGAKVSMILNNLMSAAGFVLYLIAHDPVMIFAAIFLANASERLYWTSWTAYVHDLAEGRPFERWFAFLEATKSAALGVGAIAAAIVLVQGHNGLRWLILANVVTSVAAAIVFASQRTGRRSSVAAPDSPSTAGDGTLREFRLNRSMRLITLGQFLIGPAMVLPNIALSVLFVERWHMAPAVASVQFAIATGVSAFLQTTVTKRVAGRRRGSLIAAGAILTALTITPLIFLPTLHGALAWCYVALTAILLSIASMIYLPATNAVMAEAPDPRIRGRAIGVFQTASSIGMALFPLTLGLLDSRAPWALWLITAIVLIGAAWAWRTALHGLSTRVQTAGVQSEA